MLFPGLKHVRLMRSFSTGPLHPFRVSVAQIISKSLPDLTVEDSLNGVENSRKSQGDFTVALPRFGKGKDWESVAERMVNEFKATPHISLASQDKSFLHFQMNTGKMVSSVLRHPYTPVTPSGRSPKVLIEYSSPNIAKAFHVGHLRSTIIGAFLVNIYREAGWDVVGMNYLGDWGTQFGLVATGYSLFGSPQLLAEDPIKHLFDVYVKASSYLSSSPPTEHDASIASQNIRTQAASFFRALESHEPDAIAQWTHFRDLSIQKYKEEYERLNVAFDVYTGESEVSSGGIEHVIRRLDELGLIEDAESEGDESNDKGKVVNLTQWGLGKPVVQKRDGTSIYLTRDAAAAIERYKTYAFDRMIYVVSSQQDLHLKQLFKILELLGYAWAKDALVHVNYGLVRGMSTRKGHVVFLSDIIKEATARSHALAREGVDEDVSREVGISGVKIQDMSAKRINSYTFTWDRVTSFTGDTGAYLQYAHVRLSSLLRKHNDLLPVFEGEIAESDWEEWVGEEGRAICVLIGQYEPTLSHSLKTHEPSGVVQYALRLAKAVMKAWEAESMRVGAEGNVDRRKRQARLLIFLAAREVLGRAMTMLTLRPLEKM